MDVLSIQLSERSVTGKKVNRLRREGIIPVHLYGIDREPQTLQVEGQIIQRLLPRVGSNIPLTVTVDGEDRDAICFVREVQRNPVTGDLLHVDFMRVLADRRMRSNVPIVLEGNAPAVGQLGGTMVQPLQTLIIEALPLEIPATVTVNVDGLDDFEKTLYVRDLTVGGGDVTVISSQDEMVCRVQQPRLIEEVEEAVEGEEEDVEGEEAEGAEGESA